MLTGRRLAQKGKEGNRAFRLWHAVNFALRGRYPPAPDMLSAMEYITKFAPDVFEPSDSISIPPPPWDPNGISPAISVLELVGSNGERLTSADKAVANTALLTQPDATSGAFAEVEPDVMGATPSNIPLETHKPVSQKRRDSASANVLRTSAGEYNMSPSLQSVALPSNAPPKCISPCPSDGNTKSTPSYKAEVLTHLEYMIMMHDAQTSIDRMHRPHLLNITHIVSTACDGGRQVSLDYNGSNSPEGHRDFGERRIHEELYQEVARHRMAMATVMSSLQKILVVEDEGQ